MREPWVFTGVGYSSRNTKPEVTATHLCATLIAVHEVRALGPATYQNLKFA